MAWRKFVVETLVCLVLIAAIAVTCLLSRSIFTAPFVLSAAAVVVAIVRYER